MTSSSQPCSTQASYSSTWPRPSKARKYQSTQPCAGTAATISAPSVDQPSTNHTYARKSLYALDIASGRHSLSSMSGCASACSGVRADLCRHIQPLAGPRWWPTGHQRSGFDSPWRWGGWTTDWGYSRLEAHHAEGTRWQVDTPIPACPHSTCPRHRPPLSPSSLVVGARLPRPWLPHLRLRALARPGRGPPYCRFRRRCCCPTAAPAGR